MISIKFSDLLRFIKEIYPEDEKIKKVCNIILFTLTVLTIFGIATFLLTLEKNAEKARLASTYYERWIKQLPPEHPFKQDMNELGEMYGIQSTLSIIGGALIDSSEEILKFKFSELDITEVGILETYLDKEFDKSKPEYLLLNAETLKTFKKIRLKKGELISIKLYRSGEEISFDYTPPKNMWNQNEGLDLHELISLSFVKAYVQNPDIAKINGNQITAIAKGKTKIVLMDGTHLLEQDLIVN